MRAAQKLAIVFLVALAALLAGEGVARLLFPAPDGYYVYPPGLERTFRPLGPVLPGVGPEARFRVNSLGYRGDELPEGESYRILALGGSTTECVYVDQERTWPHLVQEALNAAGRGPRAWVANAGRSGFTSRRHVHQLRAILAGEPRFDCVLLLVGVNDLCNRLKLGPEEPPPESLSPVGVPLERCFSVIPPAVAFETPFYEKTGIWRALKSIQARVEDLGATEDQGRKYIRWRRHRREASAILDELPDLASALAAYRANLEECVDIARGAGVRIVLITQPSMWRPDLSERARAYMWLGGVGDYMNVPGQPYYSIEALAEGMARYNEALLAVADELDVEAVDLAAAVEKTGASFYDDVHFNDGGSARVAEVIAGYLLEREPYAAGDG